MQTSNTGIELIKRFEGCRLNAYQDSVGVWTIGYGHTKNVKKGMLITQDQADKFLKEDLKVYENYVKTYVSYNINQNQFDALVSFTYNVGGGNLQKSTLLVYLNQGKITFAANEFDKWTYAGGKKLTGLVNRRKAEKELFLSDFISNETTDNKEEKNKMEKTYNWTLEVPEWARPTVQKLLNKKYLTGNEKGELELTYSMLKLLVINDRAGLYD